MPQKPVRVYHPSLDVLRVICIAAVIMIHTTTRILETVNLDVNQVPYTFFFNQIARFAVPVFFLVSGFALELSYTAHASYFSYLKKRVMRILIPFVFWSVIYYFFIYPESDITVFEAIITGNASYQLYFIPALFIFYLLFPLLHKAYAFLSKGWVLVLLGITQLYLLRQDYFIHELPYPYPISVAFLNFYVFIIGMVASHYTYEFVQIVKNWKWFLLAAMVGVGLFVFSEGQHMYLATYNYHFFYSQWRPSVLVFSLLVFAVGYSFADSVGPHITIVKVLSKLSFFVFFIHVIVLETLWKIGGVSWSSPLFYGCTTVVSFVVAYLVHKIPRISQLTG